MMKCVYVILTIIQLLSIRKCSARPEGAPNLTCTSLKPGFGLPIAGATPFQIGVKEKPSGELQVTISSSGNTTFQGFILQAREVGSTAPLGRFVDIPRLITHTITCENDADTVTHNDTAPKTNLTFLWRAPVNFSGEIRFHATVAINDSENYWIRSEVITFPLNNGIQASPTSSNGTQTLLLPSTTMVLSQAAATNQPLAKTPSISEALQQKGTSSVLVHDSMGTPQTSSHISMSQVTETGGSLFLSTTMQRSRTDQNLLVSSSSQLQLTKTEIAKESSPAVLASTPQPSQLTPKLTVSHMGATLLPSETAQQQSISSTTEAQPSVSAKESSSRPQTSTHVPPALLQSTSIQSKASEASSSSFLVHGSPSVMVSIPFETKFSPQLQQPSTSQVVASQIASETTQQLSLTIQLQGSSSVIVKESTPEVEVLFTSVTKSTQQLPQSSTSQIVVSQIPSETAQQPSPTIQPVLTSTMVDKSIPLQSSLSFAASQVGGSIAPSSTFQQKQESSSAVVQLSQFQPTMSQAQVTQTVISIEESEAKTPIVTSILAETSKLELPDRTTMVSKQITSTVVQSQAGSMQNTSRLVFLGTTSIVSPLATVVPSTASVPQSLPSQPSVVVNSSVIADPPLITSSPLIAQTPSIVLPSSPLETLSLSLPSSLDISSVAESPSVALSSTLIDSPTVAQSPSMSQPTPLVESSSIDQTPPTTSIPFSPSIAQTTSIPIPISSTQLPPMLSTIEMSQVTRQSSFTPQLSSVNQTLGTTVPLQTTLNQSSSMVEPTLNQSTFIVLTTLSQSGSIVPTQSGILPSTSQMVFTTTKSPTQRTVNAVVSFSIMRDFDEKLNDKTSQEYLDLTNTIENEVESVYRSNDIEVDVTVQSLRPGSIIAELLIVFLNQQLTNTPLRPLEDAISNNKLGNLTVDPSSLSLKFDECEPKCHQSATCARSSATGSFSCKCNPGLTGNGIQCTEIKEDEDEDDDEIKDLLIASLVIVSVILLIVLLLFMCLLWRICKNK